MRILLDTNNNTFNTIAKPMLQLWDIVKQRIKASDMHRWMVHRVEYESSHIIPRVQRSLGLYPHSSTAEGEQKQSERNGNTSHTIPFHCYPFMHTLMTALSLLGDELFFASVFPVLLWCFDPALVRTTILMWSLCIFTGQAAKDIFELPRPSHRDIVKCERHFHLEYGFPSTHAQITLVLFVTITDFVRDHYNVHPQWLIFAVLLSLMVGLSRVYLGVHSVMDLMGGYTLGLCQILLNWCFNFSDIVDSWLQSHSAWHLILVAAVFVLIYPYNTREYSPAWGNCVRGIASGCGCAIAVMWLYDPSMPAQPHVPQLWTSYAIALARVVVGLAATLAVKTAVKPITYFIIPHVVQQLQIAPAFIKGKRNDQRYIIEIPAVFIGYLTVGFVGCIGELWFPLLGLGREKII